MSMLTMNFTEKEQQEHAAIIKRELLIIDAYNALAKQTNSEDRQALWIQLESLTDEELTKIIYKHN